LNLLEVNYEELLRSDDETFKEALNLCQKVFQNNFKGKIRFYAPSFAYYKSKHFSSSSVAFPSISVTGSFCALKCKHCEGKVLRTMYSASTPQELYELCVDLKKQGALGCLISGGCLPNGSVPIKKFIDVITRIKRELGLFLAVHTGLVDPSLARSLKEAGVDCAMLDVIGSDQTIREIYRLKVSVRDFENSLRNLREAEVPVVPHVLVGLHYGKLKGELEALKMIAKYSPSALVIIAFTPIKGTAMERVAPPSPGQIARVLAVARLMFPRTPIALGCMRPKGEHRVKTDSLAVKAGVNAIAFPSEKAVKLAESLGYEVVFSSLCCSQIYLDFTH